MEIKKVLKIGIRYSLIFSLLTLLAQLIALISNLSSEIVLGFPFYTMYFVLILILSHKKYLASKKDAFVGILLITIMLIFFSYCFEYVIRITFYFFSENKAISTEKKQGLLVLLDALEVVQKPTFNPISDLILNPLNLLKYYAVNLDFVNFCIALLTTKVIIALIVIYFESLFHLYLKFKRNGWHAIIPIQNNLILLSISNKPKWWIVLLYIPLLKRILLFFINKSIAQKFNKNNLFALGMTVFPPYFYGEISLNNTNKKA